MPATNLFERDKSKFATEPVLSFIAARSAQNLRFRITSPIAGFLTLAHKPASSLGSQHPFSAIWRWPLLCTLKKYIAVFE
jgi:hypothetical protein